MIAVDYRGTFYPCLRYMPSSLGDKRAPIVIGDVDSGICCTEDQKCLSCMMSEITASSQSTAECIQCPIKSGCAWCSAYNYQETGDINKRVTHICIMHKARALANVYYWNKFYEKHNVKAYYENYCPDDWAVEIIGEEELARLKNVVKLQKERSNI